LAAVLSAHDRWQCRRIDITGNFALPDLHLKYLRAAGISDADLQQGNVVQFRPVRVVLAQPVTCWDELRRAA
jgi:hypothetical protein